MPLFVKPNASGSSFGVTKVKKQNELLPAITEAFKESDQVLMEEFIEGREISCGVMIAGGKEYIFPITELSAKANFSTTKPSTRDFLTKLPPPTCPKQSARR